MKRISHFSVYLFIPAVYFPSASPPGSREAELSRLGGHWRGVNVDVCKEIWGSRLAVVPSRISPDCVCAMRLASVGHRRSNNGYVSRNVGLLKVFPLSPRADFSIDSSPTKDRPSEPRWILCYFLTRLLRFKRIEISCRWFLELVLGWGCICWIFLWRIADRKASLRASNFKLTLSPKILFLTT